MLRDPAKLDEPVPPKTALPEAEAVVNSKILNWVEAAEKVQLPVMLWVADLDAGPLSQSNLTYPLLAVLEKVKWLASKVKDAIETIVPPELAISNPSETLPPALPESSSPQKNLWLVKSQPRAWVSPSQSAIVILVAESINENLEIDAVPDTSRLPENWLDAPWTKREPEINRSLAEEKLESVVVPVPNLE